MTSLLRLIVAGFAAVLLVASFGLAPRALAPSVGFPSPLGTASAEDDDDDDADDDDDDGGNSGSGGGNSGSGGGSNRNENSGSGQGNSPGQEEGSRDEDNGRGEERRNRRRPVAGERMKAGNEEGKVMVRLPGSDKAVELHKDTSIPVGSVVDTRSGSVKLTADGGHWAVFTGAVFKLQQASEGSKPVTELALRGGDFGSCGPAGPAAFAAKRGSGRKAVRGLWARGKGNFRTRGRHGTATVRGTKWYTADTCDGTLVKVKRGKVAVRDFARKRTVLVRRGEHYLARPAPKPARKSASS